MNQENHLFSVSVIAQVNSPDSFLRVLYNLCRQTIFKNGDAEIILLVENLSDELVNSYLSWIEPSRFVLYNISHNFVESFQQALKNARGKYITYVKDDISLRPDSLMLLSKYFDYNSECDIVYSDEILCTDNNQIFENCSSRIVLRPEKIVIDEIEHCLPKIFLFRNELENWSFSNDIEDLVKLFWVNALQNNNRIEKFNAILGIRYIDVIISDHEKIAEIQQKIFLDQTQEIFGAQNVGIISNAELENLPYHLKNPFNDLVSVVLLNPEKSTELELQRTLNSLGYLNHSNIEIIRHSGKLSPGNEVRVKNILCNISSGKYIVIILAGDEIFPNFLTNSIELLKNLSDTYYIYSDFFQGASKTIVQCLDYSFDKLKKFNYIPCSIFLPRAIFLKSGEYDEELPSRYSFWEFLIRLGKSGIRGYRIAQPLINIKRNIENINLDSEADSIVKARIILKHKDIFTDIQVNWAKDTVSGVPKFDNSKIPVGVIPNNDLITKIKVVQGEQMNKAKRILFVMYGWNESGGGTIFPKNVAIELEKRGWEISVLYASVEYNYSEKPYSLKITNEGNIKLYALYNRPATFIELENPEREIYDPNVVEVFKRVLQEVQPSLVHFHNLHGLTLALPKIAKEFGIPTIYTPHNYYMIDPKLYMYNSDLSLWQNTNLFENSEIVRQFPEKKVIYERRQELTQELLSQWFDITLAVSRRQKEILQDFAPFAQNIIVVHQASPVVDKLWRSEKLILESNRAVPRKIRVGYIGGVMPQKGVHILAKAAQHFLPSDIEFRIYGFVPKNYLVQLKEIDRRNILQFQGEYKFDDLERIAGEVDVGIVSSVWEDCAPLVITELNAMRLPVIASNIGGIPDFVVDGVNGFLYDYDSIDGLVSAIRYCSINLETTEKMRKNIAPYHLFADYVSHIEKIYCAMLENKRFDIEKMELIVTPKIAQMKRIADVHFLSKVESPETLSKFVDSFGFELLSIQQIEETKSYYTYRIDLKVPKPISLEEFMADENINQLNVSEASKTAFAEEITFDIVELSSLVGAKPPEEDTKFSEKIESNETFPTFVSEKTQEVKFEELVEPELNVVWEGSQFVYHSLALINREQCFNLIQTKVVELTIVPYETEQFLPEGNPKYETLAQYDIRIKKTPPEQIRKLPYLWVRHQWPPKADPPKGAKWVIMQPWEFTTLPKKFVEIFLQADELWVPSTYTRQAFVNSGIPFNKVQIVPNGIDPELFQPKGEVYTLNTNKRLKFLYVGGTTYRKGIDILLQAYVSTFTAKDNVVLVIKDMGTESVYFGQTAEDRINSIQNTEGAPEIIYIKDYLNEKEMASLYRACDVFISTYRGEGFSLPTLEAMASGLPVIVTEGGATEDFVLDTFGWKIPAYKISIGEYIDKDPLVSEAFLLEPDAKYLSGLMRSIYQNPGDITVRGILASEYARQYWTWKNSTLKVLSRIDALYGKNLTIKAMEKLVDKIDSQILLGKAEQYFAKGDLAEAKRIFDYIFSFQNTDSKLTDENGLSFKHQVFLLLRLAIIEFLQGNFQDCIEYLNQLEKISPSHIDKAYLEAKIEMQKGDLVSALEKYSDLVSRWNLNRFESVSGYSLDILLTEMGEIFVQMGDTENALQLFIEALKLNQNNIEARLGSARCFVAIKDFEEARRMIQWVLDNHPDNEEAQKIITSFANEFNEV